MLVGYRIEALLGRGGMSVVYRAEDLRLKRKVALKLLAPQLAEDERFRERFLRESELAASIDHPHVIPIYEAGEADGQLYIAMRYVEGTDLRALLRKEGALEPKRALALLEQVADALDAAHQRGLVHRDVKPGNVLIAAQARREHCYLSDFGLTKQTSSESGLTQTGQFVGTAEYIAPEQIERGPVDGRTDIYSLGCVLYPCLTGEVPYPGERLMAVLWAHVNEPPPSASEHNPDLAAEVDAVIAKALAKSPEQRYSSCGELAEAAREALGETAQASPRRRRRVVAVAVLALVAAAVAVPSVLLTRGDGPRPTTVITADSLQRIDPRTNTLAATIRVPDGGAVTVGEGSVWVLNTRDSSLLEVDPGRNAVARTIRLARATTPSPPAAGQGAVWLTSQVGESPNRWLWKYDPHTRSLTRSQPLALGGFGAANGGGAWNVAVGDGAVWAQEIGINQIGRLVRIRPDTGKVVGSVAACPEVISPACGVPVFGAGAAWLRAEPSPIHAEPWIYRFDPETGSIRARVKLNFLPDASSAGRFQQPVDEIAAGEGGVWVANAVADSVSRIDPATNRIAVAFPTGRLPVSIAVGAGAVWVANSRDGSVTRYDPRTANISTIRVGGTPVAVAVGEGGVWVVTQAG
jgi:serine/threonine protein kinase/streptogramin lyase